MPQRLVGLDGLRGIAALCVLLFHLQIFVLGQNSSLAYLAVDFFFMLSGYVMARTYEDRWTGLSSAGSFMRIRIERLWPTMAVGALISVPLAWIHFPAREASILMLNIFLIPTFIGSFIYPLNISAWSILLEIVANLLHVVILARLKIQTLVAVSAVSALTLLSAAIAAGGDESVFGAGARDADILFGLPRVVLSYTIGIILWRKWRDAPSIKIPPVVTLTAMPLFFAASTAVHNGRASWPFAVLFILVLCPMLMAGGLRISSSRWAPLLRLAGEISFPLYAVHIPVILAVTYVGGGYATSLISSFLVASLFPGVRRALAEMIPIGKVPISHRNIREDRLQSVGK